MNAHHKHILILAAGGMVLAAFLATMPFAQTTPSKQPYGQTKSKHTNNGHGLTQYGAGEELRAEMRRLWMDHISYTHDYVVSATNRLPSQQAVANRLLRNQDDIGNAIVPYYGAEAGKKLSALLRDHIMIATQVVKAAQANDKMQLSTQQQKWSANGKDIATFLAGANPNWKQADLEQMMQQHLDLLTEQVTAALTKNWEKEIDAYDRGEEHILMMADALSSGIEKQFPDKFAQAE